MGAVIRGVRWTWLAAQAVVLLAAAHVWAPVVVRVLRRRRFAAMLAADRELPAPRTTEFLVLVPAHNEAAVIGRLLASLSAQTYPRERFRVVVVSDNSTDETAAVARQHGYEPYERRTDAPSNKGQALRWIWSRLVREGAAGGEEVVVILDTDCTVAPDFLTELDRAFATGVDVAQSYRAVDGLGTSPIVDLEAATEEIRQQCTCGVRRLLGLGASILGSGVAIRSRLFATLVDPSNVPETAAVNEDIAWQQYLVEHGIHVVWWPSARLRYEAVTSMGEFRKQRNRWIGDRVRGMVEGWPLLTRGLSTRDATLVDQGLSRLQPPRSVLIALTALFAPVAWLAPRASLLRWWGWLVVLAGFGGYLVTGFALLRAPLRAYRSLAVLPAIVGQIAWISVLTALGRTAKRWDAVRHGPAPGGGLGVEH